MRLLRLPFCYDCSWRFTKKFPQVVPNLFFSSLFLSMRPSHAFPPFAPFAPFAALENSTLCQLPRQTRRWPIAHRSQRCEHGPSITRVKSARSKRSTPTWRPLGNHPDPNPFPLITIHHHSSPSRCTAKKGRLFGSSRCKLSAVSTAPPPGTTALDSKVRLTAQSASCTLPQPGEINGELLKVSQGLSHHVAG